MHKNNTLADALFEPETHAAALLILASAALTGGNARRAFKLADRRCRLDVVKTVPHLVLRAQTLRELGDTNAALSDLHAALAIAPEDIHANRRMLEWGNPSERHLAAARLIGLETDGRFLKAALLTSASNGAEHAIAMQRNGNIVTGWVAWNGQRPVTISTLNDSIQQNFSLAADATHRLIGPFENASDFALSLTDEFADCVVDVMRGSEVVFSRRLPPIRHKTKSATHSAGHSKHTDNTSVSLAADVTIIIPVYKNLEVTKACIEAAKRQARLPGTKLDIFIVNDASPDRDMGEYLKSCGPTVIENTANLGFAGSVNQVLQRVTHGDVLLLNSDAILPPFAIDRLAAAAYSADDIATVTPMSNNGELTSFPIPFVENPFPDEATSQILNNIEDNDDTGSIVDLPNGIGFCLYITRRCLDAVGPLPEIYERGYFEDVHFCLDAAAKNLRNVCATNVYVPHHGAQSFGADKRALVVRNMVRLDQLFPNCRADTAAFMRLDPLKKARERLESAWIKNADSVILALATADDLPTIEAALHFERKDNVKLILAVMDGTILRLRCSADGLMSSSNIQFETGTVDGRAEAEDFLLALRIQKCVATNPCSTSNWIAQALARKDVKIELLLLNTECQRPRSKSPLDPASQGGGSIGGAEGNCGPGACRNWSQIDAIFSRLSVADNAAAQFARRFMPSRPVTHLELELSQKDSTNQAPARHTASRPALGIIPLELSEDCQRLLATIDATFAGSTDVVVLGRTLDDLELMKSASIFVTGSVPFDEFESVARHHNVSRIFLVSTKPLFGHPFQRYLSTRDFPLAYFDWSMGGLNGRPGDILLDPATDDREIAGQIKSWCHAEIAHEAAKTGFR
jgi:O-antigen biosynthesis protein